MRTFRLYRIVALVAVGPCLSGCEVRPIPADKLFAFSNPKLKATIPGYGTWEVPTNFSGKLEMKHPDGSVLMIRVASNAAKVIGAEGERVDTDAFTDVRIADENRAIAQEQIRSTERIETLKGIFGILQAAIGLQKTPPLSATATPINGIGPVANP